MSFRLKIKYYLIHALNYTNKTADELISSGKLTVNGNKIFTNEILRDEDELCKEGEVIKAKPQYNYYALYKPVGVESTFYPEIEDNLSKVFPFDASYYVAGRLDKASEGLLIISNDGKWVNSITRADAYKEKEYIVELEGECTIDFVEKMAKGVNIGFYVTRPCQVWKVSQNAFRIILTEGKNKQIRRMCKALGNKVKSLKRIRIHEIYLSDLKPLEYRYLKLT
jgi:23S rRNA pseudouridine2604 synthase